MTGDHQQYQHEHDDEKSFHGLSSPSALEFEMAGDGQQDEHEKQDDDHCIHIGDLRRSLKSLPADAPG